MASAPGFSGRAETAVLPPEASPLRATIITEEETAKRTVEGPQPAGLSIFTDGSPKHVTICTDARAAILRMTSDRPGLRPRGPKALRHPSSEGTGRDHSSSSGALLT